MKLDSWKLAYANNSTVTVFPKTRKEIMASGYEIIPAAVPGNLELDLVNAKKLPEDIYFGENILESQKLESTHVWYFTEFEIEDNGKDRFLLFEGIDTSAEIFVDGEFIAHTENMLIPYEFCINDICAGKHELVVHIEPANLYSKRFPLDQNLRAMKYNYASLAIRKAPYMYGWDIMPRTVSIGLWKDVSVVYKNKERINDDYFFTTTVVRNDENYAEVTFAASFELSGDIYPEYSVRIKGVCGNDPFEGLQTLYAHETRMTLRVQNAHIWRPKNYGSPELYDITVELIKNGEVLDTKTLKYGIRTAELERTSLAGENGKFGFIINGKKIFVLGTNWVPTDAFPSRHREYTLRGLEMVNDLNCNMIRCWGGNVYHDDEFYDYCDAHGILVWQDFAMACAIYPNDERFCELMREEAEATVKRLRNHPCIVLWSGDNECDWSRMWFRTEIDGRRLHRKNPNDNKITRKVLKDVLASLDGYRPYLPSSPYVDEAAFAADGSISEDHLWGPRDYFKGDYYNKNSVCHFASETGYHGCPAPASLKKFIGKEHLDSHGDGKVCADPHWLIHAASPEVSTSAPWAYRIPLMTRQIERIFGSASAELNGFALQSQISQAEAMKFFIEHFRVGKWYRTGIIWWNIIDGWPQISDAVVDWYGTKKLAYEYIKRSQKPFCIMLDEPDENGKMRLLAANDSRNEIHASFSVTDALSGKTLLDGDCTVQPDGLELLGTLDARSAEYYKIVWNGDASGENQFVDSIGDGITLEKYVSFMKNCGLYDKLEGFEE